jgi:hypothetical protein
MNLGVEVLIGIVVFISTMFFSGIIWCIFFESKELEIKKGTEEISLNKEEVLIEEIPPRRIKIKE